MNNSLTELFSYSFIVRALIVGILVSLCAALLGVSLVLKRYSMIGDGLAHVGFGALSIAFALNMAPLVVSIPAVVVAAFLLLRLSENSKIKGDAAIALISSSALAIGLIATSLAKGVNVDVNSYMFGSILAVGEGEVYLSVALSAAVITLYVLLYNKIFCMTFDESFAKSTGISVNGLNTTIALLTAVTIAVGMRIMGTLLISSLIIFPALTAMRLMRGFKWVVLCSAVVSVVGYFLGILLSFMWNLPAGASVVGVNLLVFCLFFAIDLVKKSRGGNPC